MALDFENPLVGSKNWGAKLNAALTQIKEQAVSTTEAIDATDAAVAATIRTPTSETATELNASIAAQITDAIADSPAAIPATNITPANTQHVRAKLAAVRAGTDDLKLLCIGDSTTAGALSDTDEWQPLSYPSQLATLLDSTFAPAANGLAIPPYVSSSLGLAADPRWTMGTGWTLNNAANIGFGSGVAFRCGDGDAADPLLFAADVECDTFDVYYTANASASFQITMSLSVNGGAATVVVTSPSGAANEVGKATITCPAGSSNVLSIDPTAGGLVFVLAVDAYLSTEKKIRVGNAGVSSSHTTQWDDPATSSNPWASLGMIATYAPDLSIIMLGINDAGAGLGVTSYKTNLAAIVAAARQSGDVLLMSVVPSSPSDAGRLTLETEYRQAAFDLARATGSGFIDIFTRFKDYDTANAAGWMADAAHPDADGYAQIAQAVRDALYFV